MRNLLDDRKSAMEPNTDWDVARFMLPSMNIYATVNYVVFF